MNFIYLFIYLCLGCIDVQKRLRDPGLCPVSAFIDSAEHIISYFKVIKIYIKKKKTGKILGHIPVTYQYCQLSEIYFIYSNNLIPEITVLLMFVLFNRSESTQISPSR